MALSYKDFAYNDNFETRLDRWLRRQYFAELPQGIIERFVREKFVRVNDARTKPAAKLIRGDKISVEIHLSEKWSQQKQATEETRGQQDCERIKSIFLLERPDFLVLNKPCGLDVQGGKFVNCSIDSCLRALSPEYRLVHRLDRETSGVLVVAKTLEMAIYLTKLFREHKVQKIYRAVVLGRLIPPNGKIIAPLAEQADGHGNRGKLEADGHGNRGRLETGRGGNCGDLEAGRGGNRGRLEADEHGNRGRLEADGHGNRGRLEADERWNRDGLEAGNRPGHFVGNDRQHKGMMVVDEIHGKQAETLYKTVFCSTANPNDDVREMEHENAMANNRMPWSDVELIPHTGRKHQLRVHMAHIGTPIIGDSKYGRAGNLGFSEHNNCTNVTHANKHVMFLHAHEIRFKDTHGKLVSIKAPLPEYWPKEA
jgi:23S rRNA-/tRNA-specific pseudouridylate synthase